MERPKDIGKACRALNISRSYLNYRSVKDDSTIIKQLEKLVVDQPIEGFWKYYFRLRNQGGVVNQKRFHRISKELKILLRRKVKKRLPTRVKETLEIPIHFTYTRSIDFMTDVISAYYGQSLPAFQRKVYHLKRVAEASVI